MHGRAPPSLVSPQGTHGLAEFLLRSIDVSRAQRIGCRKAGYIANGQLSQAQCAE
jgi:hypothetical protein